MSLMSSIGLSALVSSGLLVERKDDPENPKTNMKTVNDLTRIDAAETKRLRKMERNKNSKNA